MINKNLIDYYSKIVYDYSRNGKVLDKSIIINIVSTSIDGLKLDNYVKDFRFDNKYQYASYTLKQKLVQLNYEEVTNLLFKIVEKDKHYDNKYEKLLEINSYIIRTVLHELIHALQYKEVDIYKKLGDDILFSKEELEAYLLNDSFEYLEEYNKNKVLSNETKLYHKYISMEYKKLDTFYRITPAERMANIIAAKYIYFMFKQNNLNSNKLVKKYEKKNLLEAQLRGYDFGGGSPTKDYLLIKEGLKQKAGFETSIFNPNEEKICNEINSISKKINLKDRLYYGLNVSFEEYNGLDSKVKRLK